MELHPSLFCLCFCLSYFFLHPFEDLGCFSGCLMSSAGIQKLFCGIYSVFKCSFDEFVGNKVFSPSYSSAILAPSPVFLFDLHILPKFLVVLYILITHTTCKTETWSNFLDHTLRWSNVYKYFSWLCLFFFLFPTLAIINFYFNSLKQ